MQRIELYKKLNPNELTAEQFKKIEREMKIPKRDGLISDEYYDFLLWCNNLPSRQESFAKFITKKLAKHKGAKILEVGCGRTGRLCRMLTKEGFIMTGMDPKLEVKSTDSIKFIKGKFDYKKSDLEEFDYVIAEEPCDATEHVVRACSIQNVPFIMVLCGVPHKLISGKQPKDIREWYDYLINIDKRVSFQYVTISDSDTFTPILKNF